ncbi:hypothetical protein [Archangium lansingense]|uniref:Uncharacterized protein n=1 Tax=Archangium lansingense TaxID=2995310 RepID=A0ABT4AI80_9BACT|nr:hypothetical protein [Archangium lansinium]MCY1081388.1 hypothetical protein [Archangium lansinium]
MTDEELSRALRGREPPANPEHRERIEQELLAAYDTRVERHARRVRSPMWRYATAAGLLLGLVSATQVSAEYKLEVGKRIQLVLPAGREVPPGLGDRVARAFVSESSRLVDVGVMMRRTPDGAATLVVDVWGDRLTQGSDGMERLRAVPELAGLPMEVTNLEGRVRDNLLGLVRYRLFRAGASPEEREVVRQRVIEELRRQEGEEAQIDVHVEEDSQKQRMRVRVRKQVPAPPSPSE